MVDSAEPGPLFQEAPQWTPDRGFRRRAVPRRDPFAVEDAWRPAPASGLRQFHAPRGIGLAVNAASKSRLRPRRRSDGHVEARPLGQIPASRRKIL
jgi:hypothetical protein